MNILEKNKELFGHKVMIMCNDSKIVFGRWTEWWDEADNLERSEETNLPNEQSILIEQEYAPIEIFMSEIKEIKSAK